MAEGPATSGRRSFGPVVLAGLLSAGLAVLAATRPWFDAGRGPAGPDQAPLPGMPSAAVEATYPAASAVSLVLLAAWGVVLVTRGRTRRAFALLAVLGALGLLAAVVTAGLDPPEPAPAPVGTPGADGAQDVTLTAWYWVTGVASLLALGVAALAVRLAPGWPEMSRRYDAPTGPATEQDLWQRLDAGDDPTEPTGGPQDPLR